MVWLSLAITVARGRQLKQHKELQQCQVVVSILFLLTLVYPALVFLFASLDSAGQPRHSLVLPLSKLLTKSAISWFCKCIEDFKPEAVIFNVEISHAVLVASCTTSMKTALLLMAVDFVHAVLPTRDVHFVASRLVEIRMGIIIATQSACAEARELSRKTTRTDMGQVSDKVFLVKHVSSLQHNRCIGVSSRAAAIGSSGNRWAQHACHSVGFNAVAPATEITVGPQPVKSTRRPSHTRSRPVQPRST